jgi:hypothetical protein
LGSGTPEESGGAGEAEGLAGKHGGPTEGAAAGDPVDVQAATASTASTASPAGNRRITC